MGTAINMYYEKCQNKFSLCTLHTIPMKTNLYRGRVKKVGRQVAENLVWYCNPFQNLPFSHIPWSKCQWHPDHKWRSLFSNNISVLHNCTSHQATAILSAPGIKTRHAFLINFWPCWFWKVCNLFSAWIIQFDAISMKIEYLGGHFSHSTFGIWM